MGAGRLLGLTKTGEIKTQLAAETGAGTMATAPQPSQSAVPQELLARLDRIETMIAAVTAEVPAQNPALRDSMNVGGIAPTENAQIAAVPEVTEPAAVAPAEAIGKRDEMAISLAPGEGAEVKMVMRQAATATYSWTVDGGVANFDMHSEGNGQSIGYEKGRGVPGSEGALEAAFDGNHGWFWRNRGTQDITVVLRTSGDYPEIKRVK